MKKFISLLLVVVLSISITSGALAASDISFRNVPWGSSYSKARNTLSGIRWYEYSGESHSADTINDIVGIGSDPKTINDNINMYSYSSSSLKVSVAGYEVKEIKMYYAYTANNGTVTRSENDTSLYAASYKFEPTDLDGVYADLTGKLTSLYGEPVDTQHDVSWTNDKYTYTIWNDANNNQVVLKLDDERESTWAIGNYIYIYYVWGQADEALTTADNAVSAEKSASESQNYGNDNTDGL